MDFFCRTLAPSSQSLGLEDWNCTSGVSKKRLETCGTTQQFGEGVWAFHTCDVWRPLFFAFPGAKEFFQSFRSYTSCDQPRSWVHWRGESQESLRRSGSDTFAVRQAEPWRTLCPGHERTFGAFILLVCAGSLERSSCRGFSFVLCFLVFVSLNVEPDRIFRSTSHIHHRIFIYDRYHS